MSDLADEMSDAGHCLVDAKARKKVLSSKLAMQKSPMGRFNLKKLNHVEVTKQYQIKLSNMSTAFGNLDNVDINRAYVHRTKNFQPKIIQIITS
jgi:hypothetical protein